MKRSLSLLLLLACQDEPGPPSTSVTSPPGGGNILLILLDDIGVDKVAAYGVHPSPPETPVMDQLASEGLRFTHAYANPTCSPSRSALLTGRHARRTGIGRWILAPNSTVDLAGYERTLAEYLRDGPHGYTSTVAGKWHLVRYSRNNPGLHPLNQGFDHHAGTLSNPREAIQPGNFPRSYTNWEKNIDGVQAWTTTYMTTDTVDEAIDAMETLSEPWFVYVPFNAAHEPLHRPPDHLLKDPLPEEPTDIELYDATVEALDIELGRMLDGIPSEQRDDTTIILVGDNGTISAGISPPFDPDRRKGTVYEGGVRVPLIVSGNGVTATGSHDRMVHLVDVFATVAELGGVSLEGQTYDEGPWSDEPIQTDGVSFLTALDGQTMEDVPFLVTDTFWPNGPGPYSTERRMIRDRDFKYTWVYEDGILTEGLYRYDDLWYEGDNLLEGELDGASQDAFERLRTELTLWEEEVAYGP